MCTVGYYVIKIMGLILLSAPCSPYVIPCISPTRGHAPCHLPLGGSRERNKKSPNGKEVVGSGNGYRGQAGWIGIERLWNRIRVAGHR